MLVSTVTAKSRGLGPPSSALCLTASTAAWIMRSPPSAWRVMRSTPMRQADAQPARDRVRDVEHLEVEHDLEAHILELLDDGGAFVGEEFKADLHPDWAAAQGFGGGEGVFGVGIVEGCNELRHEFILPEWCLPAPGGVRGGASRQGRPRAARHRPCPDCR